MIDMVKMGNLLSIARREKGYTQDELGSRLGVSAQAISKWERGMSLPDTDMLPDISRILEISVDYLLGITDFNSNDTAFGKAVKQNPYARENPLDFLIADELTIVVSSNLFKENESILQDMDGIMKGIPEMRNEMAKKRGLLIPIVRLIDSVEIPDNTYKILVRSKVAATGSIYIDKFLYIIENENVLVNGTPCTEPIYGKEAVLVSRESKEEIEKGGGKCYSISDIILTHLKEIIIKNAALLTHKQSLKAIIENMRSRYPVVVDELIPNKISFDTLHKIIASLVAKGHSIRDMLTICEIISNSIDKTSDIQAIVSEIEKSDCFNNSLKD